MNTSGIYRFSKNPIIFYLCYRNGSFNQIMDIVWYGFDIPDFGRRWKFSSESEAITPEDRKFAHRFEDLKDKIAACYPTEADSRVYNQFAAFTVHNSIKKLVDICDNSTLLRITIPHEYKDILRYELSVCGITQSYIYPDLEHLAKEIENWHS